MTRNLPLVLIILDGWGYREHKDHNAIACANTPQWDRWWKQQPHILLNASGTAVGLPDQQMGNSEVGHMHIGAGRRIPQDLTRINEAIANKDFFKNDNLKTLISNCQEKCKSLHIMGLLSAGGVHSHEHHLFACLQLCHQLNFFSVKLHLFLDGRDTPPKSALTSLKKLNIILQKYPVAKICSIAGRYYAMDRDQRWERTDVVYNLLTTGSSNKQFDSAEDAINYFYNNDISDEFIPPTKIGDGCTIKNQDSILFFNYRADRARQLTQKLMEGTSYNEFATMTQYTEYLPTKVIFPPINLNNTLGEVLAQHNLKQLRIAETEKYAHVTFFLDGGKDTIFPGEQRILIPSPKVKTYDLSPQMSAATITERLVKVIENNEFDVIICNYANADMVGHTGNFAATITAIEFLDQCFTKIDKAINKAHGQLLITADHGNAEYMYDENIHQAHTAHTNSLVPLLYIGNNWQFINSKGSMMDIAPTILSLLNIQIPAEMTGTPLMVEKKHV